MMASPTQAFSMNIEHISVSRGKSYNQCPYYYKLKYHDKIPNPGEEQFYFVYGKIIHKIAEQYVSEKGSRAIREVASDVLKGKIEIEEGKKAPKLPKDYMEKFPMHIKSLESFNRKIGGRMGITEYKFRYDLEPPNQKFVTGFIDRIIMDGDRAWIIDYKTTKPGRFREDKNTIRFDPQLRMYCRVVQKEYGLKAGNIKAALYYLEGEDVISATYNEESLDSIETEMLDLYDSIMSHPPEEARGKVGQHCRRCEYKGMCPFYRSSQNKQNWDGRLSSL